MALVLADRIKETTTTAGAGTITLAGASTGYRSFATVGDGNTTYYTIAGQNTNEWEVGIGTYTAAGTTLSRTTVLSSSNAGSLVVFSAGTKDVFVTYPAGKSINQDAVGGVTINAPTSGAALSLTGSSGTASILTATRGSDTFYVTSGGGGANIGTSSSSTFNLYTNNTVRTQISADGNTTINAPTSGDALTVNGVGTYSINVAGAASANGAIVLRGNGLAAGSGLLIAQGSDTNSYITAQNNASLFIGTNNVSRVTVNSTGNVTINAPTSGFALTVSGQTQLNAAADDQVLQIRANSNPYVSFYQGATLAGYVQAAGSNFYLVQSTAGTMYFNTGGNNRLGIANTGGVTINTPTSGYALAVSGVTQLTAPSGAIAQYVYGSTPTVGGGQGMVNIGSNDAAAADAGGVLTFTANTTSGTNYPMAAIAGKYQTTGAGVYSGYLQFITTSSAGGPTERMRINASGNVTINAPTSGTALAVNGTCVFGSTIEVTNGSGSANAYLYLTGWNAGVAASAQVYSDYNGTINYAPAAGQNHYWRDGSLNIKMQMLAAGNVTINEPASGDSLTITSIGSSNKAIQANGQVRADFSGIGKSLVLTGTGSNLQINHDGTAAVKLFNSGGAVSITRNDGTTTALSVGSSGNVTIDAPTSGVALTLNNTSGNYWLSGGDGTSTFGAYSSSGVYMGTASNHALTFFTNGYTNQRMTIGSAGNVTINGPASGNTLAVGAPVAGSYALTAASATLGTAINNQEIVARFNTNTGNQDYLEISNYRGSAGVTWETAGYRIQQKVDATWMGYIQFNRNNNGGIALGAGLSSTTPASVPDRLVIGTNGNVTINAPTSGTALTVSSLSSNMALQLTGPTNFAQMQYIDGTVTAYSGIGAYAAASWNFGTASTHPSSWYTNGISRVTVSNAGAVTINAPASGGVALTVNGISGTHSTQIADSAGTIYNAGYLSIPPNSKTAAYTLTAVDVGKHISITTGGVTIPPSVFSSGDAVVVFNNSAGSQTITPGAGVSIYFNGTTVTSPTTVSIPARALMSILCVGANTFTVVSSIAGGGTGSPSGSSGQLQYNNAGSFGGSGLSYNNANGSFAFTAATAVDTLTLNSASGYVGLNIVGPAGGNGVIRLIGNNAGTTSGLFISQEGTSTGHAYITNQAANGDIRFSTNGAQRISISPYGYVTVAAPSSSGVALTVNGISGTHSTQIADSSATLYDAGYLGIPQNTKTATYTLARGDCGKHINITTVAANVNVFANTFVAGDAITIVNNTTGTQTIIQNTDVTLRLAGTSTTGTRTIATYGVATILCITGGTNPVFIVAGAGVT